MGKTAGTSALKEGSRYTIDEWRSLPDEERWELIGGVAYSMSPAPSVRHQRIKRELMYELGRALDGSSCEPLDAPVDLFLPDALEESADTVVQPDIVVVCDAAKLRDDGIYGAPDLVVEILSPSTGYKDLNEKRILYERAGVKEYWLVSPDTGSVFRYVLADGRYGPVAEILAGGDTHSSALPGFTWRFPEELLRDRRDSIAK